jgi:hypothetical protein
MVLGNSTSALILKECDGKARPMDVTFDSLDVWVHALDLPLDMMNRAYGR